MNETNNMTTEVKPTTPDGELSPTVSTTDTGAPAPSDQFSLTVGPDGPILLHDFHFVNQMAHFNRERVPERNVHAKGGVIFLDDYQLPGIRRAVSFYVTNLNWRVEEECSRDELHHWVVVRTACAKADRNCRS